MMDPTIVLLCLVLKMLETLRVTSTNNQYDVLPPLKINYVITIHSITETNNIF